MRRRALLATLAAPALLPGSAVAQAPRAATLRVVTDGFDRSALQRDEPGLFDPGVAGTEPPRFRIRRAVGPVADPVYARVLREGPMQILNSAATPAVFEATFLDGDNRNNGPHHIVIANCVSHDNAGSGITDTVSGKKPLEILDTI